MQVLNKYKNLSEPLKASVWFTICSFLQKGIQFVTTPIFTRLLTTEQYGVYNVYNSWFQIVLIFATLNLFYGVFNNGMLKYEDDRDGFTSSVQSVSTVTTILFFIIYICFHDFFNKILGLPTFLVLLMFVHLLFFPALQYWSAKQRYDYKYRKLVIITLLMSILDPVIGIIAIMNTEHKAAAKIFSAVLVQVIVGLILYIYNYVKGRKIFSPKYWKYVLMFNIPLIPHYLSGTVLNSSDRIMINKICGESQAGIYSVAYSAAMILSIVNASINNSFIPWTYKKLKDKRYKDISNISNVILILIAALNLVLIIFAPEAIKILAPKAYYDAIWVIPPVAASVFFMFLYNLFGNIEFYFEENKFVMIASILGALLNIVLNCIFIPIFGYIAAGYTTLICYIIYSLSHYIFMNKVVKEHIGSVKIYNIKFIFMLSVVFVVFSAIVMSLYNYPLVRFLVILFLLFIAMIKRNLLINTIRSFKNKEC